MNITEIKTSKFDGFGVLVPEDAHSFEIITNVVEGGKHICFLRGVPDYECNYTVNIPDSDEYKIIGIATEITEKQAKEIMPRVNNFFDRNKSDQYPYYEDGELNEDLYVKSALESFNSLMQKLEIKPDTKTLIIQKIK